MAGVGLPDLQVLLVPDWQSWCLGQKRLVLPASEPAWPRQQRPFSFSERERVGEPFRYLIPARFERFRDPVNCTADFFAHEASDSAADGRTDQGAGHRDNGPDRAADRCAYTTANGRADRLITLFSGLGRRNIVNVS